MRSYFLLVILIIFSVTNVNAKTSDPSMSPVGNWRTVDEITGKTLAIIQIKETENHTLSGTLVKTFPGKNQSTDDVCSSCNPKDPRYNQRILGMTIMTDFKALEANLWGEGKILDPSAGRTYRCQIRTVNNGKKLIVRGYIGLPLFGRTQTWEREDENLTTEKET
jgi:uncharacterized protein (DUF2147 family)